MWSFTLTINYDTSSTQETLEAMSENTADNETKYEFFFSKGFYKHLSVIR